MIYRVPTTFWEKNSWPIKKNSWPIFNKFSGKNSRPKIYLINSTHQKYLQLCTCDVVQHMHLCLGLCLLMVVCKVLWTLPKVSEPALVPSLNLCFSPLAWDRSAWTPIDAMSTFFFLQSLQNAWFALDGAGLTQLLNWSISIHLGLNTQPCGIFTQL